MASGKLFAGTSGFAFKEWKGVFYPEGVADKRMLEYYSKQLGSVEINYTFRRMPSESTLANWAQQTGDGFQFTLKAPQRITHFKRLKDAGEDAEEFVRRARLLGTRLGTVLFQLPPNLSYERSRLEDFLAGLPPVARYAFEFRHESFTVDEVKDLLREHSVAWVAAETDASELSDVPVTAPFAYLRLRRQEYSDVELAVWGDRVRELLKQGIDVYCYFKHEGGGAGPRYASAVLDAAS
ncbi:MAG: DUF72 domain-containing protein [Actinomycetota bacterium]